MSSFFNSVRQNLISRQANKSPNPERNVNAHPPPPPFGQSTSPSPTFALSPNSTSASPVPPSPSISAAMSAQQSDAAAAAANQAGQVNRRPSFFREEYATLIVKGNFMTLAAKPVHVEEGEWLAHQIVEQYRLMDSMIAIIRCVDEKTGMTICNPECCPTMSAAGHTYTWLDNNKRPIKIPACQYIQLVQKWILGKISDPNLFPTDTSFTNTPSYASHTAQGSSDWLGKSSGFPPTFETDIRSIYRQMLRCYAHLYHGHWLNPFWHLNAYKELNTCFIHFINVGKLFHLISEKEMEPMQPLIDIWVQRELLPKKEGAVPASSAGNVGAAAPAGTAS